MWILKRFDNINNHKGLRIQKVQTLLANNDKFAADPLRRVDLNVWPNLNEKNMSYYFTHIAA